MIPHLTVMPTTPFRYYLRVRYQECDAQLVVFNARYGDYVDLAVTEFFRALGFSNALASREFDMQLVKQTTTWKAPARNNQVLEISVATIALGTTSFTISTHVRIAGAAAVICEVETIYVRVDSASLTKTPLGDRLKAALTYGAPGVCVDHAGYVTTTTTGH